MIVANVHMCELRRRWLCNDSTVVLF